VTADLTGIKYLPERGTIQIRSVHDPEAFEDEG
jgi:hypothetical protein